MAASSAKLCAALRDGDVSTAAQFYEKIQKENPSDSVWIEAIAACVPTLRHPQILKIALEIVSKHVSWKKAPDGVSKVVAEVSNLPAHPLTQSGETEELCEAYKQLSEALHNKTEKLPVAKKAAPSVCQLLQTAFAKDSHLHASFAEGLQEQADWTALSLQDREDFMADMLAFFQRHADPTWFETRPNTVFRYLLSWLWEKLFDATVPSASTAKFSNIVFQLFNWIETRELTDDTGQLNVFGWTLFLLICHFLVKHCQNKDSATQLSIFLPICVKWIAKEASDFEGEQLADIQERARTFVQFLLSTTPELAEKHLNAIIPLYLRQPEFTLLNVINAAYATSDTARAEIHAHIAEFLHLLESSADNEKLILMTLMGNIAEDSPQLLGESIDKFEPLMEHEWFASGAIGILGSISKSMPTLFLGRGNHYFFRLRKTNQQLLANMLVHRVYPQIAGISESEAERVAALEQKEAAAQKEDVSFLTLVLHNWAQTALAYPEPFRKRLQYIEKLAKRKELKQSAQHLIDVLEGRSLEKVSGDVADQKESVEQLERAVDETQTDVGRLDSSLHEQARRVADNRKGLTQADVKLTHLAGRVGDAEVDIGELDNKTLSHAPAWAKEVARLLNTPAANDWRLVARRLGYSSRDTRAWATQPDATQSMLAELYATRKTSEATMFLLRVLHEVNRVDAAAVIERADEATGDGDGGDGEQPARPPPVFLSYQWANQAAVRELRRQLRRHGFDCWMDIGQMGGGDSLYEQIDKGIRGAKVVVLCMTAKYCKSANCIREATLSNGLGKVLIPLQLEHVDWPPMGSLGPILAEKIYIEFFWTQIQNGTRANAPWPPDKFSNLLGRIGDFCTPDLEIKSTEEQKPADFDKPRKSVSFADQKPPSGNRTFHVIVLCSPDKFYEMKNLSAKLRETGYKSHVLKYTDDSVSNFRCEVIVAALSLRFVKSNMATNEVSRAAAKGRPIVPLLLDANAAPPLGHLHPVDCTRMPSRADWHGAEFDELVDRLEVLLSHVRPRRIDAARKAASSIPKARRHVPSSRKPPPADPLAREASEIRISVRPPTPQSSRGSTHIPVPRRPTPSDDDDDSAVSDDSDDLEETRRAKQLQHGDKLPQLSNGRAPTGGSAVQNGAARHRRAPLVRQPTISLDGPKLPSLFRKRLSNASIL